MPFDFTLDVRPRIPLSSIYVAPDRIRREFANILELADDIRTTGLIQPVVVKPYTDPQNPQYLYKLVAGERRYRACMLVTEMSGQVPFSLLHDLTVEEQLKAELSENVQRSNMTTWEELEGLRRLHEFQQQRLGDASAPVTVDNPHGGWSLQDTAEVAGVSKQTASRQIKMAKLMNERPDIKEKVKNLPVSSAIRVAEELLRGEEVDRKHKAGELHLTQELRHTDAVSGVKTLASESVDCIVTDPPFGLKELVDKEGTVQDVSSSYAGQLKPHDNSNAADVFKLFDDLFPELYRVLKPGSHAYFFFELEYLSEIQRRLEKSGFVVRFPVLIWNKGRAVTTFKGTNYTTCYESILFCYKPNPKDTSPLRRLAEPASAILDCPVDHATVKIHPFQKPIDLMARLIKQSTRLGDLVLDPFAGSASTILAAKQCGRKALGFEIDADRFNSAQGRLILDSVIDVQHLSIGVVSTKPIPSGANLGTGKALDLGV